MRLRSLATVAWLLSFDVWARRRGGGGPGQFDDWNRYVYGIAAAIIAVVVVWRVIAAFRRPRERSQRIRAARQRFMRRE